MTTNREHLKNRFQKTLDRNPTTKSFEVTREDLQEIISPEPAPADTVTAEEYWGTSALPMFTMKFKEYTYPDFCLSFNDLPANFTAPEGPKVCPIVIRVPTNGGAGSGLDCDPLDDYHTGEPFKI